MDIVFDIETSRYDFDCLSESQQEYILRFSEKFDDEQLKEKKREESIRYMSLYPFTSNLVSIGLLNTETNNSLVLFNSDKEESWENEERNIKYESCSEREMLVRFWDYVSKCNRVITFNGRNFDVPYLMLKSALLKVKPSRNFIQNRYRSKSHIDLLEVLTFHGMVKKFNLDFYCQSFGIESPKGDGITGMDVKELFDAKRFKDIAIYCGHDVSATYELFKIVSEFMLN